MTPRLRILVLTPALPVPSWGFGMRVAKLTEHLAATHDVSVLTYAGADELDQVGEVEALLPDVHVVRRDRQGRVARRRDQLRSVLSSEPFHLGEMRSVEMQRTIDDLCAATRFDVVQLESAPMGGFRFPAGLPRLLDEHNIEYELRQRMGERERSMPRRLFNDVEHRKARRHEQRMWREMDAVAVTSAREEVEVRAHAPNALTAVVANGVDVEHFAPAGEPHLPGTLVFTGLLEYRPNLDAARHLVEELLPRISARAPGTQLTIVGRGRPADLERLRRPNVEVTGFVPDVRPYIARAAVVVTPLRIGGGTRLKVVEALSMGKAIVSTSIGCEGLDVHDRRHLLIADDDEHFAAEVARVLRAPTLGEQLGAAGRLLAVERYSWSRSGATLERLLADAARGRSSSVAASTSNVVRQDS
jgi:glycosyltransferase involved in cell wall biosynthesis